MIHLTAAPAKRLKAKTSTRQQADPVEAELKAIRTEIAELWMIRQSAEQATFTNKEAVP